MLELLFLISFIIFSISAFSIILMALIKEIIAYKLRLFLKKGE